MKHINQKRGITLVALIITIIVLLILAGTAISISVNSTDLFSKSNTAKESWNAGVREEESSITDVLDVLDIAANPDLAKYRLIIKTNEDGSLDSPYYVNYPSTKGTIKCRVLYNDSTYGLQLISADYTKAVKLGKNDPNENVEGEMGSLTRAINSYNRAVTTLNEAAEEYKATTSGEILATDTRCVGSNPLDKYYPDNLTGDERQAMMYVADNEVEYMHDYNGRLFKDDDNYKIDYDRMGLIGCKSIQNNRPYWFASRGTFNLSSYGYYFCPILLGNNGYHTRFGFLRVLTDGTLTELEATYGFRPVFILADNVKIIGGEGTEEVPYEIGL